jgi:SAM-dependent methyltransferase
MTMGTAVYRAYQLGRRLCRLPVLKALIPGRLRSAVQRRLLTDGVIARLPDRRYMEEVLLPALAGLGPRRLLDVGVESYTRHYGRWFPAECEYWTLDINPCVAHLGAPGRHIVGDAGDMEAHFGRGALDAVLINGPFGFGIDRPEDQEQVVAAARAVLRPGGRLVIGWDRSEDGTPVMGRAPASGAARIKDPLELEAIRAHFAHEPPPGLPARIEFAGCAHVYDWFLAR